jgi:hypothetical protein
VVLDDDVEARGGDVPRSVMDQIAAGIVNDLSKALAAKAGLLGKELQGIHELLALVIGEP